MLGVSNAVTSTVETGAAIDTDRTRLRPLGASTDERPDCCAPCHDTADWISHVPRISVPTSYSATGGLSEYRERRKRLGAVRGPPASHLLRSATVGVVFDAIEAANIIWNVVADRADQTLRDRLADRSFRRAVVRKTDAILTSQSLRLDPDTERAVNALLRDDDFANDLLTDSGDSQLTAALSGRDAAQREAVTKAVRDALIAATVTSASRVDRELLARTADIDQTLLHVLNIGLDIHQRLESVEDVLSAMPPTATPPSWIGDPPMNYDGIIAEKLQQYPVCHGRATTLRYLRSEMARPGLVILSGNAWSGKSTVVAELLRQRSKERSIELVSYFVDESTNRNTVGDFLYSVNSQLIRLLGAVDGVASDEERRQQQFEDLWRRAKTMLKTQNRQLVLVVDGLDESPEPRRYKRCFTEVVREDSLVIASRLTLSELVDADIVSRNAAAQAREETLEANEYSAIQQQELTNELRTTLGSERREMRTLLCTLAATRAAMSAEELEHAAGLALIDVLAGLSRLRRFLVTVERDGLERWRIRHVEIFREVRRLAGYSEIRQAEDRVLEWARRVGELGWRDDTPDYLVEELGTIVAERSDLSLAQWSLDPRRLSLGSRSAEAALSLTREMRAAADLASNSGREVGAAHLAAIGVKACLFQFMASLIEAEAWTAVAEALGSSRAMALWARLREPSEAAKSLPWILRGSSRAEQRELVPFVIELLPALERDAGLILLADAADAAADGDVATTLLDDAITRLLQSSADEWGPYLDRARHRVLEVATASAKHRVCELITRSEREYISGGQLHIELLPDAWVPIVRASQVLAPHECSRVLADAIHELVEIVDVFDDPETHEIAAREAIVFLAAVADLIPTDLLNRVEDLYDDLVNPHFIAEAVVAICALAPSTRDWAFVDVMLADAEARVQGAPIPSATRALGALAIARSRRYSEAPDALVSRILDATTDGASGRFQRSAVLSGIACAASALGAIGTGELLVAAGIALDSAPNAYIAARLYGACPAALAQKHSARVVQARESVPRSDHGAISEWLSHARVFTTSCARSGNQAAAEIVVQEARRALADGDLAPYYEALILPGLAALNPSAAERALRELLHRRRWNEIVASRDIALTLGYFDPIQAIEVADRGDDAAKSLTQLALVLSLSEPDLAWSVLSRIALAVPPAFLCEFVDAALTVGGPVAVTRFIRDGALENLLGGLLDG